MKKLLFISFTVLIMTLSSCKQESKETALSIPFEKYTLPNGLTVIINEDHSDPIAAVAVYYHVGSSREVPGKTGFAHLFEHMMFQRSENVGEDELFKNIMEAGGTLNGSTSQDRTNYYQVVPKNAIEMVLWMESDRMGYLENTVTKAAFVNQQNVVQNEKRQGVDNVAYGFEEYLVLKNLFPEGHPYSWDVIGDMNDLTNATVEDVKAFHRKFYSPNNATLVISGDVSTQDMKGMIEKYFGEIPAGEPIEKRNPMPANLTSTVKLYHEDNFARAPQLTMVFPTVERFSKDSYALNFLGEILSNTKKAPMYTVLVKDKKLTSRVMAVNQSQELAGAFYISVGANPGVNLTDVEKAVFEAFDKFEKEGFTEDDLTRIKARYETRFYSSFASVQGKAFQMAEYQMYTDNPAYYANELAAIQTVTIDDVKNAYNKYIKGKNYVQTSFVPKGQVGLIAEGSVNAGIVEEDVTRAAEVKADDIAEEPIIKTATKIDRSVKPPAGPDPLVNVPQIWTSSLKNGIEVWGIIQNEMPLVQYSIVIKGGQIAEDLTKAGLANLTASLMNEGTKNKTPEELEDAIGLLGASIRISAGTEDFTISVSTMAKNLEKTVALVEEMLLEPRWDEEQFKLAKERVINNLKRNLANPDYLASATLNRLLFGKDNILALDATGTEATVAALTTDDLRSFYNEYFSPSSAKLLIAGDVDQERVEEAFASLGDKWQAKQVSMPEIKPLPVPDKAALYFVDVPGAKQSVISIGCLTVPRNHPDFNPLFVANYKLGAASLSGIFNTILREEKGFTYGANSSVSGYESFGTFKASSRVRTNATLESVTIFKTEMEKYGQNMPQEYIDFTKAGMIKSNARRFETIGNLLGMLNTITSYNLPVDYVKQEEDYVRNLTPEQQLDVVKKYIDPSRMYYVVVGDAKTQLKDLEKVGLGKPVLFKD
ncbi:MAG TPA: pitrilysin family protein [Bacteroidales bacterium]|nr:pitrilysin family protein [Bacteroidales bacterium]